MTLKHFCQYLTFTFLLLCLSPPVWPVDYAKIVQGFEAAGDIEAAYPVAVQLAQQQDTYPAWREVAVKYVQRRESTLNGEWFFSEKELCPA